MIDLGGASTWNREKYAGDDRLMPDDRFNMSPMTHDRRQTSSSLLSSSS